MQCYYPLSDWLYAANTLEMSVLLLLILFDCRQQLQSSSTIVKRFTFYEGVSRREQKDCTPSPLEKSQSF